MSRPVDALLEYLRTQEIHGVTHVHLDQEAREILRALHQRGKSQSAPAARPVSKQNAPAPQDASPARPASRLADPPAASAPTAMPELVITGQTKAERIASLRAQAEKWPAARQLGTLRDTMVFSTGNLDARIVFVGEAPGYQEERQCEPFVGPAGEKLDAIFKAMGFSRAEVYISNIVKFRPATASQTTNNRKPSPEEMAACLPFIRAELEIIRPECVVALGATAAEGLLGTSLPVAQLRENWHQVDGLPLRATYHPSFLLHSKSGNTDKRKVWEDMLAVMEKLGMPISEKQRGFFLPKA